MRRPALAAVAVAVGTAAVVAPQRATPVAATAEPPHRAVVVVDTGREVRRVCVRFAEDFLTGQELLIRAGTDPVFKQYSGLGAAVCALCGVGCPADDSCLTCGGDDYWTYSRAKKGTSTFALSGGGASSTRVYDGDVEGWRWSNGLLPAYASVDQVCGPAPGGTTTTSSAAAAATATTTGSTAVATTTTAASNRRTTTTQEAARVAGAIVEPTTTSAFAPEPTTTTAPEDTEAVAAPPTVPTGDNGGGGSPASVLAFAAVLAALLGWAVWLRRARNRSTA